MQLERLTVTLRPRSAWEAVDLGCALIRRDYPRLIAVWFITILPLWTALALLLRDHPSLFSFIVWWLKPLYDRVPLFLVSRATFGDSPGLRESLRQCPRMMLRFILPSLLWRRLSPSRSFFLPVWLLEGQRGQSLRKRAAVLGSECGSAGVMLTWTFIKLEVAVLIGLLVLASFAAPDTGLPEFTDLAEGLQLETAAFSNAYAWWLNAWYLVAVSLMEPFYVGAGFGLYLNCRTRMEGWDIEIAFKKASARLSRRAVKPVLAALLLLAGMSALSAADAPPAPSANAAANRNGNELAREILAQPEFEVFSKTERIWIPAKRKTPEPELSELRQFLRTLATITGYTLLTAAICFLAVLLVRASRNFRVSMPAKLSKPQKAPRLVLGLEVAPETLPGDILAAARRAWTEAGARQALSLLYRGALSALIHQHRVRIAGSDTEQDCLNRARGSLDTALTAYLEKLTGAWTFTAYGSLAPSAAQFESLCRDWPFAAGASAPAKASVSSAAVWMLPLLCAFLMSGCSGHWEDIKREIGYKGPARTDPFLAAGRLLEKLGCETKRSHALSPMPEPESGLIFASSEGNLPAARAEQLLRWTARGGHLVYALSGTAPYNDWSLFATLSSRGYRINAEKPDPVLAALGVIVQSLAGKTEFEDEKDEDEDEKEERELDLAATSLRWGRAQLSLELPRHVAFQLSRKLRANEYAAGKPDAALLLSLRHGGGRVTLLTHAHPLRNRYLGEADHGRLLKALAGPSPREALFVIGMDGSFWRLLWERGWRLLVALALLTLIWLWMSLPRFGPIRPALLNRSKSFSDHVVSLGHFYRGIRRQSHLISAAQAMLQLRLRQTHPHLDGQDEQRSLLAARSRLSRQRIDHALQPAAQVAPSQVPRILQDLQTLRQSLS